MIKSLNAHYRAKIHTQSCYSIHLQSTYRQKKHVDCCLAPLVCKFVSSQLDLTIAIFTK